MSRKSVVVGGGFVGLASALHLQRIGRQVLLVERDRVSSPAAASYGNAGTMATYANVPVNSPGLLRKLPGMLLDAAGPLSIKPTAHLASMLPWVPTTELKSGTRHLVSSISSCAPRHRTHWLGAGAPP